MRTQKKDMELYSLQISELCRRKLLRYADSFYALSRSYEKEILPQALDRQTHLLEHRLGESRRIIRSNMREMAKIMTEAASEVFIYQPMEARKKKSLIANLAEEGIVVESPCYLPQENGRNSIALTMYTAKGNSIPVEEAVDMISVILDKRLLPSAQSPYLVEATPRGFLLEEEACFHVMTGFSRAVKEGETASGDNYSVVETENGKILAMLSDGTGSGETAGKDSARVLDLMEKMAESGYDISTAIHMVNRCLFALDEDNNHPTLDVCRADLYEGILEITKLGGGPTFLKRENRVEVFTAESLPLGSFEQPELKTQKILLQDGDMIIMVTDGVLEAFGGSLEERGLQNAILAASELNPKHLAEHLMGMAICSSRGRVTDDMTIGVIGFWNT